MPNSEYPTVEKLFEQMISHESAADRRDFLDRACTGDPELRQRLEALLTAHEAAGKFLDEPAIASDATLPLPLSEGPGTAIDRYKLLQRIGEGGFGVVYMAEQREPVNRKVALKIIKLGMDTKQVIARFEAERQALALMDHPNIAKVFDAGATETGRPYFVMELVRGEPITEYSDKHNLDVRERLMLFQHVCRAVQHAHQKGIIHRDIKPSNVMITLQDGEPISKVIDFGIAKATNARLTEKTVFTEFRQFIGTPEYMSPEQAEMSGLDIDTRSDVYSLGVLLYELLTGTTPFDARKLRAAGYAELQRIIREETPPKPSTRVSTLETLAAVAAHRHSDPRRLSTLFRGDLDWIVMKSLEKDRTRRYETANGFAMDIQRYLDSEPVLATPPSASYRLKKLIRRNKGAFGAAAAVFVVLTFGIIGTTSGLVAAARANKELVSSNEKLDAALGDANEQRARAEENERQALAAQAEEAARAEELEQVAAFQESQLSGIDTALMGGRLRGEILEERRGALRASGAAEEALTAGLAELETALAGVNFTDVALAALEENIFDRALAAIDEQFIAQPLVRARLLQTVANTMHTLGLHDKALLPQEQALETRRRELGDDHPDTLASIGKLAGLLIEKADLARARPLCQEALEGTRRAFGDDDAATLTALHQMAALYHAQGKFTKASEYCHKAIAGRRRVLGDDHPDTLRSMNGLAAVLYHQNALDEAEALFRQVLNGYRRKLGDEHPMTQIALSNLSIVLQQRGKHGEAEELARHSMLANRRLLGDDHPNTLASISTVGGLLQRQGKPVEGEPFVREALRGRRRVLGDLHPETLGTLHLLGGVLHEAGKLEEATAARREEVSSYRRVFGREHPHTLRAMGALADSLLARGELADAERLAAETVDIVSHASPHGSWAQGPVLANHAQTLAALGRFSEAEQKLLQAHAHSEGGLGAGHQQSIEIVRQIADLYDAWQAAEPDAGHDARAAEWRAKLPPPEVAAP